MSIRVEITGLDELRKRFTNLDKQFDMAVMDAIEDSVLEIRNEVIKGIQRGPASGIIYQKYNPRRTHQASAPGQPPMTDTGRLVSSIYYDQGPLTATVGSRLAYAHYLEFGARMKNGKYLQPRPIWKPVTERVMAKLSQRIMDNLENVTR